MLQVSSLNQLIGQVPHLQVGQAFQPQQAAPVQQIQPQPNAGQNLIDHSGAPYGFNSYTSNPSLANMSGQYNQEHYIPQQNQNYDVANTYGYHDLSGQQHAAFPLAMQGASYHVPGQGVVMNAIHSLAHLIR